MVDAQPEHMPAPGLLLSGDLSGVQELAYALPGYPEYAPGFERGIGLALVRLSWSILRGLIHRDTS
jgi:hypothetical protein